MSTDEIFAVRFRKLCKKFNVTQADMAHKLNMTQSALSKQLNGKSKVSTDVLVRISEYFNTSTDYLLGKTDEQYVIPMEEEEKKYLPPEVARSYASLERKGKEFVNTMIVCLAEQRNNL
ncbi:MAG: helix-turn-helix transcriptional regulator [Lachnospiraceae bacterium]|nr:helix-turn-helix transcriptional regulator [Lachnospiraceae bacterium]